MIRQLTTHEAAVKTVTVEIKALTVSGRQMTLSVFRQLLSEPLLLPDGTLTGTPWGLVNYYWGGCDRRHLHVVWQKGEELRRACVWPTRQDGCRDGVEQAEAMALRDERDFQTLATYAVACHRLQTASGTLRWTWASSRDQTPIRMEVTIQGWVFCVSRSNCTRDKPEDRFWWALSPDQHGRPRSLRCGEEPGDGWSAATVNPVLKHLIDNACEGDEDWSLAKWESALLGSVAATQRILAEQQTARATWAQHYQEIAALKQLFIAV